MMKKSHIIGVAAGTVLSTAFMLTGCERPNAYLSEKGGYALDIDRGTFSLSKVTREYGTFKETLAHQLSVNFEYSRFPSADNTCVGDVYSVEGDAIAFDHNSPLAKEFLQSAPDNRKADIVSTFNDAEKKGIPPGDKLSLRTTLECGEAIQSDFARELKEIITLRERAHKQGFAP